MYVPRDPRRPWAWNGFRRPHLELATFILLISKIRKPYVRAPYHISAAVSRVAPAARADKATTPGLFGTVWGHGLPVSRCRQSAL